ncbi:uncharacterized protein, partial [Drosophila kikkawai]|uniref:Uncharacterized protein n=1 Tax=Drosophila kikkawai TaxID=30033 RepID=A0A6P4JBG0_DROKI
QEASAILLKLKRLFCVYFIYNKNRKSLKNLVTMLTLWRGFLFGLFAVFILYLLKKFLRELHIIRRLINLIESKRDIFEQVSETDEDEGIVDDEILFTDLNPEQSLEKYRRVRFEAAAIAMRGAVNRAGRAQEHGN